jgi:hypothetical protein
MLLFLILFIFSYNFNSNWVHNDSSSLNPFAFQVVHNYECHVTSVILYSTYATHKSDPYCVQVHNINSNRYLMMTQ